MCPATKLTILILIIAIIIMTYTIINSNGKLYKMKPIPSPNTSSNISSNVTSKTLVNLPSARDTLMDKANMSLPNGNELDDYPYSPSYIANHTITEEKFVFPPVYFYDPIYYYYLEGKGNPNVLPPVPTSSDVFKY
jgi:hypothetical protein